MRASRSFAPCTRDRAVGPGRLLGSLTVSSDTGFFTDVTLCIGCKACEVACKLWNQLPADDYAFSGNSYDNTDRLSATSWRHVAFVEQMDRVEPAASRWMMLSDVCKHCTFAARSTAATSCARASCMRAATPRKTRGRTCAIPNRIP